MHPFLSLPSAYVWFRTASKRYPLLSPALISLSFSHRLLYTHTDIYSFLRIRFSRIRLSLFFAKNVGIFVIVIGTAGIADLDGSSWSCAQFLRDSRLRRRRRWVHECLQSTRNQSRTSWRARARQRWREAEGRGWNRDRRTKPWSRRSGIELGTKLNLSNEGPLHLSSGRRYGRTDVDQPSPLLFLLLFLLVSSPRKHLLACFLADWLSLLWLLTRFARFIMHDLTHDTWKIQFMLIILVFERRIFLKFFFLSRLELK